MTQVNSVQTNNSNNLPKIVKRITKANGDNYIITMKKNEYNEPQKGIKGYCEWLTLYKEKFIADGVKTYEKVKEKEIISENNGRTIKKKTFSEGKKIVDFIVHSTGTMSIKCPELDASIGADSRRNIILNRLNINSDILKCEKFFSGTLRPEVKRFFKYLARII